MRIDLAWLTSSLKLIFVMFECLFLKVHSGLCLFQVVMELHFRLGLNLHESYNVDVVGTLPLGRNSYK